MRWPIRYAPRWSPWFAWHPVRIGDEKVWWEWVEREAHGAGGGDVVFSYRLPTAAGDAQ